MGPLATSDYFYRDGDKTVGPFDADKLLQLYQANIINDATLIRENNSQNWLEYSIFVSKQAEASDLTDNSPQNLADYENSAFDLGELQINSLGGTESQPSNWLLSPTTPWRRYGARLLDISINGSLGVFLLAIGWYSIAPYSADEFFNNLNPIVDTILTVLVSTLISGFLIGFSGSSIGKWVFGIRVTSADGRPIGIKAGIFRDLTIWMKGLAFGIPLFSLITLYISYSKLKNEGSTSWDADGSYVVTHRPNGTKQYILNAIGILLILVIQLSLTVLSKM